MQWFDQSFDDLAKKKSCLIQGPVRLCKFCLLGIFFPVTLLCIPLYMRFISLRPHVFTLSPNDMKLLNYEHTVSTMWCKEQTLRMNSSFNAYLLPEKPKLQKKRQRIKGERAVMAKTKRTEFRFIMDI